MTINLMLLPKIILGGILAVSLVWSASAEAIGPVERSQAQTVSQILRPDAVQLAASIPPFRPDIAVQPLVRVQTGATLRPMIREDYRPAAVWDTRRDGDDWTRAVLTALTTDAAALDDLIPRDISTWCPTYAGNPPERRRAFWVGLMSALAQQESTLNPEAMGGGGQWVGLLQIYPPTARQYGCEARTAQALRDPEANLACAARIMAVTVARDEAVAIHDSRWRGVAADWGPMTSRIKRGVMSDWTRQQEYCKPVTAIATALRPVARPQDPAPDFEAIWLARL